MSDVTLTTAQVIEAEPARPVGGTSSAERQAAPTARGSRSHLRRAPGRGGRRGRRLRRPDGAARSGAAPCKMVSLEADRERKQLRCGRSPTGWRSTIARQGRTTARGSAPRARRRSPRGAQGDPLPVEHDRHSPRYLDGGRRRRARSTSCRRRLQPPVHPLRPRGPAARSRAARPPSRERHALLRREALELALYTFKYVNGVESVAIFLPPPPGPDAQASAVFLKRGDVKPLLSRPLSKTLAPGAPSIGTDPGERAPVAERRHGLEALPLHVHAGSGPFRRARPGAGRRLSGSMGCSRPRPRR